MIINASGSGGGGGQTIQYTTMPTASASNVGSIYQYTGTTTSEFTNGQFYEVVALGTDPETYGYGPPESSKIIELSGFQPALSSYYTLLKNSPNIRLRYNGNIYNQVGRNDNNADIVYMYFTFVPNVSNAMKVYYIRITITYTYYFDNLNFYNYTGGPGINISSGIISNTLNKDISLTGTSGTLTSSQFITLNADNSNYILCDGVKYNFCKNDTTNKQRVYSNTENEITSTINIDTDNTSASYLAWSINTDSLAILGSLSFTDFGELYTRLNTIQSAGHQVLKVKITSTGTLTPTSNKLTLTATGNTLTTATASAVSINGEYVCVYHNTGGSNYFELSATTQNSLNCFIKSFKISATSFLFVYDIKKITANTQWDFEHQYTSQQASDSVAGEVYYIE